MKPIYTVSQGLSRTVRNQEAAVLESTVSKMCIEN